MKRWAVYLLAAAWAYRMGGPADWRWRIECYRSIGAEVTHYTAGHNA